MLIIRRTLLTTAVMALSLSTVHALPPELKSFLDGENNAVTEDGFLPSRIPASMDFARLVVMHWQEVLNNMESLAPDLRRQALVVVAAELLPPKDYVQFVSRISDLKANNQISIEALHFILWARMGKDGFLAFNYDQPDVAAAISKLESHVMSNATDDWRDFFADIKSGKIKQRVIEKRNREGDKLPESMSVTEGEPNQPNRRLIGGNAKQDVKLDETQPAEAVTPLASVKRVKWTMVLAIPLLLACLCLIGVVVRAGIITRNRE